MENYWNFFGWNKSIWFQIGSINWILFPIESIVMDLNYSLKPELIEISQWHVNFACCQRYPIKIDHTYYVCSTHWLCTLHDFLNISIFRCFFLFKSTTNLQNILFSANYLKKPPHRWHCGSVQKSMNIYLYMQQNHHYFKSVINLQTSQTVCVIITNGDYVLTCNSWNVKIQPLFDDLIKKSNNINKIKENEKRRRKKLGFYDRMQSNQSSSFLR